MGLRSSHFESHSQERLSIEAEGNPLSGGPTKERNGLLPTVSSSNKAAAEMAPNGAIWRAAEALRSVASHLYERGKLDAS
ncbi:hypothetical protein KM043_005053 [Ampulex compressa]|nr:hypothetical protein KM043_005053 [Ampulex compressa]